MVILRILLMSIQKLKYSFITLQMLEQSDLNNTQLVFVRHGESLKNQACEHYQQKLGHNIDWHDPDFIREVVHNTLYLDAHLSSKGKLQCLEARQKLIDYQPDLIICSPLQRALQTCSIIFEGRQVPRIVQPLVSETFKHTSEICRSIAVKKAQFPEFDFSRVQAQGEFWFIKNDSSQNQAKYFEFLKQIESEYYEEKARMIGEFMHKEKMYENAGNVRERARRIKELLQEYGKKYKRICMVSHFYTIRFLCCQDFDQNDEPMDDLCMKNCQTLSVSLQQLLSSQ